MLKQFIAVNREKILRDARARAIARSAAIAPEAEMTHGLPVFLDQLGDELGRAARHQVGDHADLKSSAGHHGEHLFNLGLTVAQVINGYGDLCQVITGLAVTEQAEISASEFQMLNLCLDEATAGAVTAYAARRERAISDDETERLGLLAHELRNALNTAILSFASIKRGAVATSGSTSAMVDRSHIRLQTLIDRSLADVRLDAGLITLTRIPVWEIIEEAEISASMVAEAKGLHLAWTSPDHTIIVAADRPILSAAIANLLQNAFKFTLPGTTVKLRALTSTSRVLIEVEDACGGLPPGAPENLLRSFVQKGHDRSGLGLGLSICTKAMKVMAGELRISDLPGRGCIFALDLPRQHPPLSSINGRQHEGDSIDAGPNEAKPVV
jgi:signal transduction histidine kinase